MSQTPFTQFLHQAMQQGGMEMDDALAAMLPLMRDVQAIHDLGLVAPLRGLQAIQLNDGLRLGLLPDSGQKPAENDELLYQYQAPRLSGLEIVGESRREVDHDALTRRITTLDVGTEGAEISRPVYLPNHVSWEHQVGHHDALTDVFSLGMLLASLVCGLDFTDREDLESFVEKKGNLFALAKRLHPVVAAVITSMTELYRSKRAQDLPSLIRRLETYRDQPVEMDLTVLPNLDGANKSGRRKIIQTHLRDRLFEVSRRNRLLYFKATQSTLNLTMSSVPLVLDYRNVKPEQLFYWHGSIAQDLSAGNALALQRWLRLEEAPYIPGQLDKLISDARRDRAEYGFSQLRLVIAFLRWNNLKEMPQERIHSPLLMMPVELVRKKGVKDHYTLESSGTEAEVNPALRHHLKQLYNLDLPESIDLRETSLANFHEQLVRLIQATEPGVTLTLMDKPRIQIIHERARQRVDQYRRRMNQKSRAQKRNASLDYSNDPQDFRPLGLQLFQKKILPPPLPLRELTSAPPAPRTPFMVAEGASNVVETERKTYTLVEEAEGNPYAWEIDLCALTLANFNYRKMTLVRDYANLIEQDTPNQAFDRVFSIDPKPIEPSEPPSLLPTDQYLIIAADATQVGAIAKARSGESLIIQGPPGTGKSQTITNLIADYVARGKRVLFVCEKRAAIDVVFYRLRQQGLDELCCLIHDSQTDKKEFILNLKQTYESWLTDGPTDDAETKRNAALRTMEAELAALQKYVEQMAATGPSIGISTRDLVLRLIELRGTHHGTAAPELTATEEAMLPSYEQWLEHGDAVVRIGEVLQDLGTKPVFALHPLRWLGEAVISSDAPLENLATRFDAAEQQLDDLGDALQQTGLPMEHWDTLAEVAQLLEFSQRLQPMAHKGLLDLMDAGSARSKDFAKLYTNYQKKQKALEATRKKTTNWREKLPAEETTSALAIAGQVQGFLAFLKPAWWRLRKVLSARYDFSKHAVKPTWTAVLQDLAAEHTAEAALEAVKEECQESFASADPEILRADLATLAGRDASPAVVALREQLLLSNKGSQLVETLAALAPRFHALRQELNYLIFQPESHSIPTLARAVREMREEGDALPELLPALRELATTPPAMQQSLRLLPLSAEEFEAACARKALEQLYREDRLLQRFDGRVLQQKLDRLAKAHRTWLGKNAGWIRKQVRKRFTTHVQIANQSAAALDGAQKQFKKVYTTGRRELEHEFGKTMRFKSIRDLAADSSGAVVRDLKPIWLMSPLSVSDTLPLEPGLFDVVIFDEASQILVEEAIPAAYRAPQVIVVGDEMQLPPTTFFSGSGRDQEDEITVEEAGESVNLLMDADSFLTQCARNLPSTMLAWHYRSRYEALISYSNAAFYGGELYTIPDRIMRSQDAADIRLPNIESAASEVTGLLSRPISFIYCEQAPYEDRRNATEAAVIAQLARGILLQDTKLSIGVAAFSEAQQGEIEAALESLAETDADFAARLEAEYVREEDDQFCGLFVKNLENVQGDERDIILMSVCYGKDRNGKMLMNFGPINQRGGEKRLNVIFSRARQHMAIISSIQHTAIRNDYNDGARALKNFLQYAESLSRGDAHMARTVLEGLNPLKRSGLTQAQAVNLVSQQLVSALQARGWAAEMDMGQSRFRCDVAVRATTANHHQLAILLDGPGGASVLERYHTQPSILRAFGWQVIVILAKDWWHEPQAVLDRIERLLKQEATATEEEDEEEPDAEPTESLPPTPPAVPHPAPTQPTPTATAFKRYECTEGGASKFWEIGQEDTQLTIRFGRLGTNGQTQTKTFADAARSSREVEKLVNEKLGKGYVAVS